MVQFGLAVLDREAVATEYLEQPGIPIVHTRLEFSDAIAEMIVFASNREGEGRVDNVIFEGHSS